MITQTPVAGLMGQEQQDEKKVHTHTHICGWLYWGRSSRMSDEHIHTQVHAPVAGCVGAGAAGAAGVGGAVVAGRGAALAPSFRTPSAVFLAFHASSRLRFSSTAAASGGQTHTCEHIQNCFASYFILPCGLT